MDTVGKFTYPRIFRPHPCERQQPNVLHKLSIDNNENRTSRTSLPARVRGIQKKKKILSSREIASESIQSLKRQTLNFLEFCPFKFKVMRRFNRKLLRNFAFSIIIVVNALGSTDYGVWVCACVHIYTTYTLMRSL